MAVSITAGTVAIASAAPSPRCRYRVPIAVGLVAFVTLANLRGVKEAGTLFAIPTYGFVAIDRAHADRRGSRNAWPAARSAETADLPIEAEHDARRCS